jgi:hypothetical protein
MTAFEIFTRRSREPRMSLPVFRLSGASAPPFKPGGTAHPVAANRPGSARTASRISCSRGAGSSHITVLQSWAPKYFLIVKQMLTPPGRLTRFRPDRIYRISCRPSATATDARSASACGGCRPICAQSVVRTAPAARCAVPMECACASRCRGTTLLS